MRLMFARDARPVVRDVDRRLVVSRSSDSDRDLAIRRRILDGVIEQVDEGLPQNETVRIHGERRVAVYVELLGLLLCKDFHHGTSFACESQQRDMRALKLNLTGVST